MSDRLRYAAWTKWAGPLNARYGLRDAACAALWGGKRPPGPELVAADVADTLGAILRASLRIVDPSDPM